jgi:hypothetical protein
MLVHRRCRCPERVPVVSRPRVTANSKTGAGRRRNLRTPGPRAPLRGAAPGDQQPYRRCPPKSGRYFMTTEFEVQSPGSEQVDTTVQVCTYAGMPGCPTTQSQHGSVRRAAIALWIAPAPARSALPPAKQKSETRAARHSDLMRPCTGAVDSVEREVTRPGEA